MPRITSAVHSDDGDAEEGLQRAEIRRLAKQYRTMENDREANTQESQVYLKRQKAEIDRLQQEKKELAKDLALAECRNNQKKDERNTETLINLSETQDDRLQKIKKQQQICDQLDEEIAEWEAKVSGQNKAMGGANMEATWVKKTQKQIRVLENRLYQTNKRFNTMLTNNKGLRDEIDDLRHERTRYERLKDKLDEEVQDLRRKIGEAIENSTTSYDARDEAQSKMILLKEKADKDKQTHESEMKELCRILDHDRKLKEFMGIKCMDRKEDPRLVTWRERKEAMEAEKKKESAEDTVETYEEAFMQIKEMVGEDDLPKLVEKFIENEDKNFALFNYVNEQNSTIEQLHEQKSEIEKEIAEFQSQGVDMESQRKVILRQLEEKMNVANRDFEDAESKNRGVMKILDQLRAGIDSLFTKINCDRSSIDMMLGSSEGVTNESMIQYLGIIEQRANELLGIHAYLKAYKEDEEPAMTGKSVGLSIVSTPGTEAGAVAPPALGEAEVEDEDEVEEDEQRPFTRGELQTKVKRNVQRKELGLPKKEKKREEEAAPRETSMKKSRSKGYMRPIGH